MTLRMTPRQVQVACLVACGLSDKRVGEELEISIPAVRFHLHLAAQAIRKAKVAHGTTPREIIVDWYRECRRRAFARPQAA
jgi:ATP/maltotriose-dependent transcriptional regulator MalT